MTYDIALVEQPSGDYDVVQDRRVLIAEVDYDYAVAHVERIRKPDEKVFVLDKHGGSREITRDLRVNRRASRRGKKV